MVSDKDQTRDPTAEREDALLRDAFANVGKRQDPPQGKLDRWEAVFRAELGHKLLARKQRRLYIGAGAAIVLLLVGIAQFMTPQSTLAPMVATVIADNNGNKLFSDRQALPVEPGLEIKVGDALLTGPDGNLTLDYRGADIRLKGDTSVRFHAARLELMHGAVYVDTGDEPTIDSGSVIVSTDHASFTHTGTQFLVQTDKNEVVAAVREGAIIASNVANPQKTPLSAAQGAQQIRISASGKVETRTIARHGGVWSWVAAASPAFNLPNANVHDVLSWATEELGLELSYSDDAEEHTKGIDYPGEIIAVQDVVGALKLTAPSIQIEQTASGWLVAVIDDG